MGGACGDLITSMIDLQDSRLDVQSRTIKMPLHRQQLKKPHVFPDDLDKDRYLDSMALLYSSVPSHDIDYHVMRGHRFVGIRVQDLNMALWAAQRFRDVHRPEVWRSVTHHCNITSVAQYAQLMLDHGRMIGQHTVELLELEDIVSGRVVPALEHIIGRKLAADAVNYYSAWQTLQNDIGQA